MAVDRGVLWRIWVRFDDVGSVLRSELLAQLPSHSFRRGFVRGDPCRIRAAIGVDAEPRSRTSRSFAESAEPGRGSERMGRTRTGRSSAKTHWHRGTDVGICRFVSVERFSGTYLATA